MFSKASHLGDWDVVCRKPFWLDLGKTVTSLAINKKLVLIWPLGGAVRRAANFPVSERLC